MYSALNNVVSSVNGLQSISAETWVVCLTDGESSDGPNSCMNEIQHSATNLHIIVIGVGLSSSLYPSMENLCSKYLPRTKTTKGFFIPTSSDISAIQGAFQKVASRIPVSQTFELDGSVSDDECRNLIQKYRPKGLEENMLLQQFWVRFLYRRVKVMDENEDFNFNEEYDELGSSLMETMLAEAERLILCNQKLSWSEVNYPQLIYDFSEGKPLFRLICTAPEKLDLESRKRFESLNLPGFYIPTTAELEERQTLDRYLSQAMGLTMQKRDDGKTFLEAIDKNNFVLTLDFTMKLLNIHERIECRIPCIMEGETGVSKTALTRMFSILRNSALQERADLQTLTSLERVASHLGLNESNKDSISASIYSIMKEGSSNTISSDVDVARQVESLIKDECLKRDSIFDNIPCEFMNDLNGDVDSVGKFLDWFTKSHLRTTFFEICVDSAVTSEYVEERFCEIIETARLLQSSGSLIVVFLDEVNTSSVLGLFKEIIIDHSLNGEQLPPNLVVVAACNPARTLSITQGGHFRENDLGKEFFSGHYQVYDMPLSMSLLRWSYGSLNHAQEREFIYRRMQMLNHNIPADLLTPLTELVSIAHEAIRIFAAEHIYKRLSELLPDIASYDDAQNRAMAMVSLRDIQRVFALFEFFMSDVGRKCVCGNLSYQNAMLLTIGITYYIRLDCFYRMKLLKMIDKLNLKLGDSKSPLSHQFEQIMEYSMNYIIDKTMIPTGIALTEGLKENIFTILVCTLSRIPLMIVGPPGTSKTLSVNIVTENASGEQSQSRLYRDFPRLQPFHYQCSKASTSDEVASVFTRAIQRQRGLDVRKDQCLVFMDEAGLPEEERESLKVLHYFLEGHMSTKSDVSFVCISNHILDAAKSNRCICLLRPEPNDKELIDIVYGVLFNSSVDNDCLIHTIALGNDQVSTDDFAQRLCSFYLDLLCDQKDFCWFKTFYGLRDFVHLLKAIYRLSTVSGVSLTIPVEAILKAFDQNFNGIDRDLFLSLVNYFWKSMRLQHYCLCTRSIVDVVLESLNQTCDKFSYRPRYKLIIDGSDDDSVMRLLKIGYESSNPHMLFKLSGLEEGAEIEKLNLVSGVKYAALQGHLAILSQTADVHECFYDLFNLNFKKFSSRGVDSYYANISIGGISRPV